MPALISEQELLSTMEQKRLQLFASQLALEHYSKGLKYSELEEAKTKPSSLIVTKASGRLLRPQRLMKPPGCSRYSQSPLASHGQVLASFVNDPQATELLELSLEPY